MSSNALSTPYAAVAGHAAMEPRRVPGPSHVAPAESMGDQISAMESAARRLQEDLALVLGGLGDLRERMQSAEQTAGDRSADGMRKEVGDTLRQQTDSLEAMDSTVQTFQRRWARFEVNTSQRKSLMLNIKARRLQESEQSSAGAAGA